MPTQITLDRPARERRQFRLEGWHVLVILMGFFGVVGGVNAVMLRMALTTMPGLDARNGYDVSQNFNRRIAAARDQDALGLTVDETILRAGEGAVLMVDLRDKSGNPVKGAQVAARLEHPAIRTRDLVLALNEDGKGRYSGQLQSVANGGWTIVVEVRNADAETLFVSRNRVTLGGT